MSSSGLGPGRPWPSGRDGVEIDLEGRHRARRRRAPSSTPGWNSPNAPSTVFGPELAATPERPGWNQAGASRLDLQLGDRRAEGVEHGQRVGLGVEHVDGARHCRTSARPPPPIRGAAARMPPAAAPGPPAGRRDRSGRPRTAPTSPMAAVGVALRGRQQAGQQARAHVASGRRRSDWRGSSARRAAAEELGVGPGDERPGHRLDHAARGERALGGAVRSWPAVSTGLATPSPPRQRCDAKSVDAVHAHDLLDEVGLAVDVRAPGRHRDRAGDRAVPRQSKPSALEDRSIRRARHVDAGQPLDLGTGKSIACARFGTLPATTDLARLAAAEVEDQPRSRARARGP